MVTEEKVNKRKRKKLNTKESTEGAQHKCYTQLLKSSHTAEIQKIRSGLYTFGREAITEKKKETEEKENMFTKITLRGTTIRGSRKEC